MGERQEEGKETGGASDRFVISGNKDIVIIIMRFLDQKLGDLSSVFGPQSRSRGIPLPSVLFTTTCSIAAHIFLPYSTSAFPHH